MKKSLSEIKSDIRSNGISATYISESSTNYIATAISLYRLRYSNSAILEMLNGLDIKDDYAVGRRFTDNDTVTRRITSAITRAFLSSGYDLKIDSDLKIVDTFIQTLSGSEMDALILDALRDCASSDHWYLYEKEWN